MLRGNKTVVIAFGRFQPPTVGHAKLIDMVEDLASRLSGDALVFPSPSQDPKKNPLSFRQKVGFLKQLFPQVRFNSDSRIRGPFDALQAVSLLGYEHVVVVVGQDRAAEFKGFGQYVRPRGNRRKDIVLKSYRVVSAGDRTPGGSGVAGMSGTSMRTAVSAGDFQTFREGIPGNAALAKQIFVALRGAMGLKESKQLFVLPQQLIALAVRRLDLRELAVGDSSASEPWDPAYPELKCVDCGRRWAYRHHNVKPNDIVKCPNCKSIDVQILDEDTYAKDSPFHKGKGTTQVTNPFTGRKETKPVTREAEEGTPKQASEVDRLRLAQKQQLIQTKQRQNAELTAAETRDLQKKSREAAAKLNQPKTVKSSQ
jgi:hypothetical protein